MDPTFRTLLSNSKVQGRFCTHVSQGAQKGKYQFNRHIQEELFKIYTEQVIEEEDPNAIEIGLSEQTQKHMPVLVDVDIKLKVTDDADYNDQVYTVEQVEELITIYQITLSKIIENCKEEDFICVLMEKPPYRTSKGSSTYFKNGFHLHFPGIFLNKKDQKDYLIPRIKKELQERNTFGDIVEDSSELIDSGYLNSPWLMYGSSKGEGMMPYKITRIYNSDCEPISLEEAFKKYEIYSSDDKRIKLTKSTVRSNLVRILSVIPCGRPPKEVKKTVLPPAKQKAIEERMTKVYSVDSKRNLEVAKRLVPLIDSSRAEDHTDWMNVGWALYNSTEGSMDGMELWNEFTQRGQDPRGEDRVRNEWNIMGRNSYDKITMGTIHFFAKADSPEKYDEYKREMSMRYMENSIEGSHIDIARLLRNEFINDFVCASIENRLWYRFNGVVWERMDSATQLREKIPELEFMYKDFEKQNSMDMQQAYDNNSQSDIAKYKKRHELIWKLKRNVKTTSFINNVITECSHMFFDPRFKDQLDINPCLIAFTNGVYDLDNNVFRKGCPEDFLSKTMKIPYKEFDDDDEEVIEVKGFLERIFPDKSLCRYFMDIASDLFVGGNHQKKVYFFLGAGDNGKSVLQKLLEEMFGDLAIKFDTNLITGQKPSSGSAHAELARAGGGVRLATLDEPNKDEQINSGVMKKLSGNDSYWARDLFEKGKETREITPLFKLFFVCVKGDTCITLGNGMSVSIEKMEKYMPSILGWCTTDRNVDSLRKTTTYAWLDKGEQQCIQLTLEDGTQITCTPSHRFLTCKGEWIQAKDVIRHVTNLKMGITGVNCDDMFDSMNDGIKMGFFQIDSTVYKLDTVDDRVKAAAFCRLIGYIGCRKFVNTDCALKTSSIVEDIQLLTDTAPCIVENNCIYIPRELVLQFHHALYNSKDEFVIVPEFLSSPSCPKFLVREFIAGMFSAYGRVELNNKSISFTRKINEYYNKKFHNKNMQDFYDLIQTHFGNSVSIKYDTRNETEFSICEPYAYMKNIGFRYDQNLIMKGMVLQRSIKFREMMNVQYHRIINRCKMALHAEEYLCPGILSTRDNSGRRYEVYNSVIRSMRYEPGYWYQDYYHNYTTLDKDVLDLDIEIDDSFEHPELDSCVKRFLTCTGLANMYYQPKNVTPQQCWSAKVVDVQYVGEHNVYDINVHEDFSNYVANGVISHNCNKLPHIKYTDKAVWNRIRVLLFESTFCRPGDPDNIPPESYIEQLEQKKFPMILDLERNLPKMAQPFAWLLLQHRLTVTTREEPEKVLMATKEYTKQVDLYRQFMEEHIVEEKGAKITLTVLYETFKDWFRQSYPGHTVHPRPDVQEYFETAWGTCDTGKKWHGFRLRTAKDREEDGELIIVGGKQPLQPKKLEQSENVVHKSNILPRM